MTADDALPGLRAPWADTAELGAIVRAALMSGGPALAACTPEALAPLDQFHPGGLPATHMLARLADLRAGLAVLDVGGGVGGPARTLASAFGCAVLVVDLTPAYCQVGAWLTARTGLGDRVTFVAGDALALPCADGAFDVVWTQASGMNVAGKERLYAELHRVLRPGGRLALLEPATGRRVPLRFPVPWADEQARSFLRPPAALHTVVTETGFRELVWQDVTAQTVAAMGLPSAPSPLGVHLLLGADARAKLANLAHNLATGRLALVQGVFERP